jgi:hypothetical protein
MFVRRRASIHGLVIQRARLSVVKPVGVAGQATLFKSDVRDSLSVW